MEDWENDCGDYTDNEVIWEVQNRNIDILQYYLPKYDIRTASAYEKLFENIERVPIERIEQLLEEYKIY